MDRVYTLTGTANLLGVIDSTQRAQAELQAKRAVRTFRSILQTEVVRLHREAERIAPDQRQAAKADPATAATAATAAMAAVVQQQGRDIADFDQATQREAQEDTSFETAGNASLEVHAVLPA